MTYQVIKRSEKDSYNVSVIIPVFNVEEYLAQTIQSVFDQTLNEVELVLVDDGSTDHSDAVIQSFLDQGSRITYVKQENQGPGEARNKGIKLAKGEFICFLDSDDLLPREALEVLLEAAMREEADLITGASISFNSHKKWYILSHSVNGVYNPGAKTLQTNPELFYSVGPCNKMYKKELIKNLRFPLDIKITEDHPFVIEAYLKAQKIYTVDHVIYYYRKRETDQNPSLSQSRTLKAISVLKDIMKSLNYTDQLWDRYVNDKDVKQKLRIFYYNRLIQYDIWPSIIHALKSNGEVAERESTIYEVCGWAGHLNSELVAYVYRGSLSSSKKLKALIKTANRHAIRPLKVRIFIDRCRKLKEITKSAIKKRLVFKYIYFFFKQQKRQDKIFYVSSRITKQEALPEAFLKRLNKNWPNYEFVYSLQGPKTLSSYLAYLKHLATSRVIILDDEVSPFSFVKPSPEIKLYQKNQI